jgi:hypothetical protein
MRVILLAIIGITFFSFSACTSHVFNDPLAISTKSEPIKNYQPIKTVKTWSCDYFIIFISIRTDPRDYYDTLLTEAKKAGGVAVIDMQFYTTDGSFKLWAPWPLFVRSCFEATGIAARYN